MTDEEIDAMTTYQRAQEAYAEARVLSLKAERWSREFPAFTPVLEQVKRSADDLVRILRRVTDPPLA